MCYVVGLTGGIGSGKSTIGYLFASLGVPIVDADVIAREIVKKSSPLLTKITQHFGKGILLENGELNRPLLRQKIFQAPEEKIWLENLLHPAIHQACQQQLHSITAPYVLFIAPLLIENNLTSLCQSILVVDVTEETQIKRASLRDNLSPLLIEKMIQTQVNRQTRLKWATNVICNDKPLTQNFLSLAKQVLALHNHYLAKQADQNKL